MKQSLKVYGFLLVGFVLLAAVVFRCGWATDKVFSGSDANIGILAVNSRNLPARFFGGYDAAPLFGGASKTPLSVSSIGKSILPPELFSNTWYAFYLILSSLALIAYLRLWNLRWMSCLLGALSAFWMGSITIAASGHLYKLGVVALFSFALLCVEKSVRAGRARRVGWAVLAGISVGLMLLEQQDVGLLAGLFLGVYTLFRLVQTAGRSWLAWLAVLLPIAAIGLGFSATTALSSYTANVIDTGIKESPEQQWDYITQWSMVPSELPDLVAPGYSGWSTGNPDGPYWGDCGQSAEWKKTKQGFRNFRLDSSYIGLLPIGFALVGFWAAASSLRDKKSSGRIFLLWSLLGVAALLLSFGKFSPLYKLFYQLPLMGNIRAPIKFLHNFQVIIGILAAYGVDHLLCLSEKGRKKTLKKLLWIGAAATTGFVLFSVLAQTEAYERPFTEWGQYASIITSTISKAWLHVAVMAVVFSAFVFALIKKFKWYHAVSAVLLVGAIAFDSVYITSHYFKAIDVSVLKKGNVVLNYLKENQGDERFYFTDPGGVYNSWMGLDVAYHGLQPFNFWQMSRMPSEYKEFLAEVGRNQIRMWELASVKYITASAGIMDQLQKNPMLKEAFEPVMFYRFGMQGDELLVTKLVRPEFPQDQVLLYFKNYIPRFALFHDWETVPLDQQCRRLADPSFNARQKVLLDEDHAVSAVKGEAFERVEATTTQNSAVIKTDSGKEGILLFTQRDQPEWRVFLDGKPVPLLRCNYLCMGVAVPAGKHEVQFKVY
ncbi:MAG: YfhO family protein [Kiritimatiellales bacterium]|nr:YfhO family protein [Kiritimatiellales bacterium]MCF7864026.1 YfhO family protein [Kiritimatiellales bacterium]